MSEQHLGDANDENVDASDDQDDDNNDDNDEEEEQEDTEHWDNNLNSKLENEKFQEIAETEDDCFQIPKIDLLICLTSIWYLLLMIKCT